MPKKNVLNTVKNHRIKAGLLIKELSEKTNIPEIVLHGIEAEVTPARISHLNALMSALGVSADKLFPRAVRLWKKHLKNKSGLDLYNNVEALKDIEALGLNVSGRRFTVKILLKNGVTFFHSVDYTTYKMLKSIMSDVGEYCAVEESGFTKYNTEDQWILLNVKEIVYCHFLFDPDYEIRSMDNDDVRESSEEDEEVDGILVYLTNSPEPLSFQSDPDGVEHDIENDVCGMDGTQFQDILADSSLYHNECSPVLSFVDIDGEEVFFRTECVALMSFPLEYASPKVSESILDDYCQAEDREEAAEATAESEEDGENKTRTE